MPDKIKLIALDLDGTLLNSRKELSPANLMALERAAAAGIEIVPTTGRFFGGMPEAIRELPFLHYAITINGAQVQDLRSGAVIYRAEIPNGQARKIMEFLDTLPVIYDCYKDNWGYMTASMQSRVDHFTTSAHYRSMVRQLREPVPELKAYLQQRGGGVQKIQLFTQNVTLRAKLLDEMEGLFKDIAVSTSVPENIEINQAGANKGAALASLAQYLGLPMGATMAFGDGLNDLSMIKAAGVGVAMENACPAVKAAADMVTVSCDEDGVAGEIERLLKTHDAPVKHV